MTSTRREIAQRFYRALQERDIGILVRLTAAEFQGHLAEGLPDGLGGHKDGRDAMLTAWARVDAAYNVAPWPDEIIEVPGGRVLATGRYVGHARKSGSALDAVFAHVLEIPGDEITALWQFTDSSRWKEALSGDGVRDGEPESGPATAEKSKAADRAIFGVWSTGDLDDLDGLVAPHVVHHDPYDRHAADGLAGMKETIARYRQAFPDAQFIVEDQIAEGDKVVTRWRSRGTHLGSLTGEAPTGNPVTVTGIVIERLENRTIVESWRNWDVYALLRGIGVL